MERVFGLVSLFFISLNFSVAQSLPMGSTGGSRIFIKPGAYAFVTELPQAPRETAGDYFLVNSWLRGDILLTDSLKLEALYFKYNLKDDLFEIKTEQDVKLLPGRRVIYFDWKNNQSTLDGEYQRADGYDLEGIRIDGFLKIIYRGSYSLVAGQECKLVPANYNTALNVGERNDRIVKDESYYLLHDNKLMRVDSNKKKFSSDLKVFSGHDLSSFIKENKVDPREIDDLILVTEKLRTL